MPKSKEIVWCEKISSFDEIKVSMKIYKCILVYVSFKRLNSLGHVIRHNAFVLWKAILQNVPGVLEMSLTFEPKLLTYRICLRTNVKVVHYYIRYGVKTFE